MRAAGDYDLTIQLTWGAPYDPHASVSGWFASGVDVGEHGKMFTDPQLDGMIAEVLATKDTQQRYARYKASWSFLDEHAAAAPVVYSQRVYALRKGVEGFKLTGTEYELDLSKVTIAAR